MLLTDSTSIVTRDKVQVLQIDNPLATAAISLFGGHILSFKPKHDGRERLWISQNCIFDGKKAIRGGIPICWPWFGDHADKTDEAAHGYVRTQAWEIIHSKDTDTGTTVTLKPNTSTGDGFKGNAQLTLTVHIGKRLSIQLHTTNLGDSSLTYNCALHSYFAISDIKQCELLGLNGQYSDKTRNDEMRNTPQTYLFNEETDRVHMQKPNTLTIADGDTKTDIQSSGHDSIVVWNPWQDKSISMADMADDSYLTMVCVETAVTQGQEVSPNSTHVLAQIIC